MGGRGRYLDDIFNERLWRFVKQQPPYLHEINDGFPTTRVIDIRVEFHNLQHPHTALDQQMHNDAYFGKPSLRTAA